MPRQNGVCMPGSPAFPIVTARLRLRPLRPDDLETLAAIYRHPEVERWIGPHSRDDVARELALHIEHQTSLGWSFWAVEERETGHHVASQRVLEKAGLRRAGEREAYGELMLVYATDGAGNSEPASH